LAVLIQYIENVLKRRRECLNGRPFGELTN